VSRTHLPEPVLRAYLDEELDWPRAATCALHLRRCTACAAALEELRALDQRTSTLLARVSSTSWPARARRLAARRRAARWPLGLGALGVAAASLVYVASIPAGRPGGVAGVRDVCCWDLDGGGLGDDGIFTRSRDGQVVECAIVYDDADASRSLTPADVVRAMPTAAGCSPSDPAPSAPGRPPATS
jgi:hypothetical protein